MGKKLLILLSLAVVAFLSFIIVKIPDSEWALVSACIIVMISTVFFVFEDMETSMVIIICLGAVMLYIFATDIIYTPSESKTEISRKQEVEQYHEGFKIHTYDELEENPAINNGAFGVDPAVNGNANRGGGPNR